jgi:SAM-dependent methyltransferase
MNEAIQEYYGLGGEVTRLDAGPGVLEKLRTRDVLARILPAAPASVLDVGGGAGVYATWLAARGYQVTLIDPVQLHVDHAVSLGVTAKLGDARELPEGTATFDAVLLLGPLYHLTSRSDRVAALREAARVTRPGGLVVAATISRFAGLYDMLARGLYAEPDVRRMTDHELATGVHEPVDRPGLFTTAYFHHPDEVVEEFDDAGLPGADRYAVEAGGSLLGNSADLLAGGASAGAFLDALRQLEREPSLLGASSHLLTVARKR